MFREKEIQPSVQAGRVTVQCSERKSYSPVFRVDELLVHASVQTGRILVECLERNSYSPVFREEDTVHCSQS